MFAELKIGFIFAAPYRKTRLVQKQILYFRGVSSVGLEHLVYTQGVTGSNPVLPTFKRINMLKNKLVLFLYEDLHNIYTTSIVLNYSQLAISCSSKYMLKYFMRILY